MNTPITDAASIRGNMTLVETYAALREVASRLETDRAALMESLETADFYMREHGISLPDPVRTKLRSALSTARANFATD